MKWEHLEVVSRPSDGIAVIRLDDGEPFTVLEVDCPYDTAGVEDPSCHACVYHEKFNMITLSDPIHLCNHDITIGPRKALLYLEEAVE